MEIVDDNGRYGNSPLLIFSGHLQQLVLTLVAQLALPEAGRPIGESGRIARQVAVDLHHIRRLLPRKNQIIRLIGAVRAPQRMVSGGLAPSRRRVVPEKPVSQRGINIGQRGFGIVMHQIAGAALSVKGVLRLLTQTVKMLSLVGVEDHLHLIVISLHMDILIDIISLELSMENRLPLPVISYHSAVPLVSRLQRGGDHTVGYSDKFLITLNDAGVLRGGRQQCPALLRNPCVSGGAAAETVLSVRLYHRNLIPSPENHRFSRNSYPSHTVFPFLL